MTELPPATRHLLAAAACGVAGVLLVGAGLIAIAAAWCRLEDRALAGRR